MSNDTAPVVEFGDLPPDPRVSNTNVEVVEALKTRPGQWAKIATKDNKSAASTHAGNIRRGVLASWRPIEHFEVTRRGVDVWARYVGEQS